MPAVNIIKALLIGLNYQMMVDIPSKHQFVFTGINTVKDDTKRIGYCVQVRKNKGCFGSDIVFLRHSDGSLTTHENQAYFAMTKEQEEICRSFFKMLLKTKEKMPNIATLKQERTNQDF